MQNLTVKNLIIRVKKMKLNKIILISACIFLSACATPKMLTSDIKSEEITDLKLLEPYSYISMIKKGNKGEIDDSVSNISKNLNINILKNFDSRLPITGEIVLADTEINKTLEKEFEYLVLTADRSKNLNDLKITPTLDQILEENNTRFGLIIINTGFTREKGNYGKEIAKGVAVGLLTLGAYQQTPIKAHSTIYAMIVDSKEDNIAFFRKSTKQNVEPLEQSVLTDQYKDIFKGYFLPAK